MKPARVLRPGYLDAFRCIGSACEDTCCIGWNVHVDHSTYDKYRACSDSDLGPSLHSLITINEQSTNDDDYAKIALDGAACPFLADGLCSIQKRLGEEYLSNMCATYPRVMNRVDDALHQSLDLSCPEAARVVLQKRHIPTTIMTSSVDMEARSLGKLLTSVARDSEQFGQPLKGPSALVFGGETTVEVQGTGIGGRNQETVLSTVERLKDLDGVAIAALGTDGIDGNSPAAGAIVDSHSIVRARQLRLRVSDFAERNDAYNFFRKLNDNIVTGPTGTNVGDLYLLIRAK